MPELPEVETVRRDLATRLLHKKIKSVAVANAKTVGGQPEEFSKILKGSSFVALERRGKLLIFQLDKKETYLLIHLKMTGQLIYLSASDSVFGGHSLSSGSLAKAVGGPLPNKHTRVTFTFTDKSQLFFNDLRKFGYLKIVSGEQLKTIVAKDYGPEPLTNNFVLSDFADQLKRRRRAIKAVLLDQKVVAGLGNIYTDEVLFAAGVRPQRTAASLTAAEVKQIYQAIKKILPQAIKYRGTTFSDYVDSRGHQGNFSAKLKVYGRGGQPCPQCSRPIIKVKVAGRGTCYCPCCQK
jgi:formamidopyrimidine-DNA glycosylase